ncbi:MAG: hypothetical protein LBE13_20300 [Bacteroidales bacterium]|jgi:hypothetical protein|nr:hypothetical protein [Bacteroidales bacterium]
MNKEISKHQIMEDKKIIQAISLFDMGSTNTRNQESECSKSTQMLLFR